jgi:hypothetical protein
MMTRNATLAAVSGLVLIVAVAAFPLYRPASGTVEVRELPAMPDRSGVVEVMQLATPVVEIREMPAPTRHEAQQLSMASSDHSS